MKFRFNQETYFDYVISFSFFLSSEFTYTKPIYLHNGFIHLFRTHFESEGIITVTAADKKAMINKYGTGGLMFSPDGIIYLHDLREIDFYDQLFGFNNKNFVPQENKHYLYLIFNQKNGYFKIERSKNPLKREKTLQAEEPEIALLKIWEAKPSFERELHKK